MKNETSNIDICSTCGVEKTLYISYGKLICNQCGEETTIVIDSDNVFSAWTLLPISITAPVSGGISVMIWTPEPNGIIALSSAKSRSANLRIYRVISCSALFM